MDLLYLCMFVYFHSYTHHCCLRKSISSMLFPQFSGCCPHTHTHTHYIYIYIYIHKHTHIHTHTHTHIYIYTHAHTIINRKLLWTLQAFCVQWSRFQHGCYFSYSLLLLLFLLPVV
ncbi:hypothetical protein LOAG_09704, partial [Loa loa]